MDREERESCLKTIRETAYEILDDDLQYYNIGSVIRYFISWRDEEQRGKQGLQSLGFRKVIQYFVIAFFVDESIKKEIEKLLKEMIVTDSQSFPLTFFYHRTPTYCNFRQRIMHLLLQQDPDMSQYELNEECLRDIGLLCARRRGCLTLVDDIPMGDELSEEETDEEERTDENITDDGRDDNSTDEGSDDELMHDAAFLEEEQKQFSTEIRVERDSLEDREDRAADKETHKRGTFDLDDLMETIEGPVQFEADKRKEDELDMLADREFEDVLFELNGWLLCLQKVLREIGDNDDTRYKLPSDVGMDLYTNDSADREDDMYSDDFFEDLSESDTEDEEARREGLATYYLRDSTQMFPPSAECSLYHLRRENFRRQKRWSSSAFYHDIEIIQREIRDALWEQGFE